MTVPERVRMFVRHKKISVSEFCRTLDVSTSYVSSMSKSMSLKVIQRISQIYPELNILWLQTGEGEMLKHPEDETEVTMDINKPCRECDRKDGKIELLMETNRELQRQLNEMTALYIAATKTCEKQKDDPNGGGAGDNAAPSFRRNPLVSPKRGKI